MIRLLTTPHEISRSLQGALRKYRHFRWSVAWASTGFSLCDQLLRKRKQISQLVVGTHFYQTHPDFLEAFVGDARVRVVLQPSGVFHPKIYLFENNRNDWECLVGSPNFTGAAFSSNVEVATYFDSSSPDSHATYGDVCRVIDGHWSSGDPIDENKLAIYRSIWNRKIKLLGVLAGTYGGKAGKPIVSVPIVTLGWQEFVSNVRAERNHPLSERLDVLRAARTYFKEKRHLSDLTQDERRRIAGLAGKELAVDWGFFGSMKGAGWLWTIIDKNDQNLSASLDAIPSDGLVGQNDFEAFVERFKKATPKKGDCVAVASRFLSMKRPDTFVCLDSKNRSLLCKAFGIPQNKLSYDRYWSAVTERIRDAVWWNAPRSSVPEEEEIWLGRAALLDALYYKP
jgi:HKD family nuclease